VVKQMSINPRTLYDKYMEGDHITDQELKEGLVFYNDLSRSLFRCGPTFRLAAAEANRVYEGLRAVTVARSLRIKVGC
jgi:hypothetical protein